MDVFFCRLVSEFPSALSFEDLGFSVEDWDMGFLRKDAWIFFRSPAGSSVAVLAVVVVFAVDREENKGNFLFAILVSPEGLKADRG